MSLDEAYRQCLRSSGLKKKKKAKPANQKPNNNKNPQNQKQTEWMCLPDLLISILRAIQDLEILGILFWLFSSPASTVSLIGMLLHARGLVANP